MDNVFGCSLRNICCCTGQWRWRRTRTWSWTSWSRRVIYSYSFSFFVIISYLNRGGGGVGQAQCQQALQFFNQWWPTSALTSVFQVACRQVGATQAWSILQSLLGVPVTGEKQIFQLIF